jgi:tetratricopeptide (TPR) repeat protein
MPCACAVNSRGGNLRLDAALGYFEAASRVEGGGAINEVPLGLILLQSTDAGAAPARPHPPCQMDPAMRNGVPPLSAPCSTTPLSPMTGPPCAAGATPCSPIPAAPSATCPAPWARWPAPTKPATTPCSRTWNATTPSRPPRAAQLLGWLTQIGRHADAVRWLQTLPTPALQTPPLAVLAAEALRATADWPALAARLEGQNWGTEFEFLRWAYALQAARALGQTQRAEELWSTLRHHTERNGPHALFSAGTLYSWGQTGEAETIWWQAAEQGGKIATDALGALARHYQTRRDADGQYRVFRQLHFLQPAEADLANNFAFFAALLDRESRLAESLARKNHAAEPANETYSATLAFVWLRQNRAREALALIEPLARAPQNPAAVHFAYGLALAQTGRKTEARPLLNALPESSLTLREVELIQSALAD